MADQLATPADLNALLQTTVDSTLATLLLECATGVVQDAAGQRIVQVVGDTTGTIVGDSDSWLSLPQIPVTAVTSVVLDGTTLTLGTDYKVFGNRLWRKQGWQTNIGWPMDWQWGTWVQWPPSPPNSTTWFTGPEPSGVVVTYTHGIPAGDQRLQLGRQVCLSLAATAVSNPDGASSIGIDDYHVTYDALAARMELSDMMRRRLRKAYGRRGGLVRVG